MLWLLIEQRTFFKKNSNLLAFNSFRGEIHSTPNCWKQLFTSLRVGICRPKSLFTVSSHPVNNVFKPQLYVNSSKWIAAESLIHVKKYTYAFLLFWVKLNPFINSIIPSINLGFKLQHTNDNFYRSWLPYLTLTYTKLFFEITFFFIFLSYLCDSWCWLQSTESDLWEVLCLSYLGDFLSLHILLEN